MSTDVSIGKKKKSGVKEVELQYIIETTAEDYERWQCCRLPYDDVRIHAAVPPDIAAKRGKSPSLRKMLCAAKGF